MSLKQELKKYSKEELEELKHVAIKLSNKLTLDDLKDHDRDTYDDVVKKLINSYKSSPKIRSGGGPGSYSKEARR